MSSDQYNNVNDKEVQPAKSESCWGCKISGFLTFSTIGSFFLYETRNYKSTQETNPSISEKAKVFHAKDAGCEIELKTHQQILLNSKKMAQAWYRALTSSPVNDMTPNNIRFMRGAGFGMFIFTFFNLMKYHG
ncbi:hypothetical protein DSO57_1016355 [Entomophthora muscae]|uniref:Uncharacterized protein n=1 Tax=Entomophthora muscae TaxID=34485 RepID=A0ACC2UQP7_9FUNG|nr:hypothetical protein DSO57_1016355 [Entomophthora muscae]